MTVGSRRRADGRTAEIQIRKFLPADAPKGTQMPTGQPFRYRVRACDPRSSQSDPPGRLFIESGTVVDTLPAGAVFVAASPGGTYDGASHTVTWPLTDQPAIPCSTGSGGAQYWVEVQYPSGEFDGSDQVTNTVDASGVPYGASEPVTATHSVFHTFGTPGVQGAFCKRATTPIAPNFPCNSTSPNQTWIGPWMQRRWSPTSTATSWEASFLVETKNTSVVAALVDVVDPVPCFDNGDGASPAMYSSKAPGERCAAPAFVVRRISAGVTSGSAQPVGYQAAADAGNEPTYVTPSGDVRPFIKLESTASGARRTWFVPQAGDVVTELRWSGVSVASNQSATGSLA